MLQAGKIGTPRRLRILTICAAILLICQALAPAFAQSAHRAGVEAALARAAQSLREKIDAAGVSLAVIDANGALHAAAVGSADLASNRPYTPQTLSFTGSIGKTYAGAVAQSLIDDGVLEADAPISRYVGDASWFADLPNGERITFAMLLNHSAGLADYPDLLSFQRSFAWRRWRGRPTDYTPQELISFASRAPAAGAPGEHFAYSDTNFLVAGLVMEAASGRDYYDLLRERVLAPLDLRDTRPADRPDLSPRLAVGYGEASLINRLVGMAGPTMRDGRMRFDPSLEWTGGGLIATTGDIARFYRALFVDEALGPDIPRGMLSDLNPAQGHAFYYGRGVFVQLEEGRPHYLLHGGTFPGYKAGVVYDVDARLVLAVQSNTDFDFNAFRELLKVRDAVAPALTARAAPPE